ISRSRAYLADHGSQVKELVIPHYNTLLNIYFFGTSRIEQAHTDMGGSTVVTFSASNSISLKGAGLIRSASWNVLCAPISSAVRTVPVTSDTCTPRNSLCTTASLCGSTLHSV